MTPSEIHDTINAAGPTLIIMLHPSAVVSTYFTQLPKLQFFEKNEMLIKNNSCKS